MGEHPEISGEHPRLPSKIYWVNNMGEHSQMYGKTPKGAQTGYNERKKPYGYVGMSVIEIGLYASGAAIPESHNFLDFPAIVVDMPETLRSIDE